MCTIGLNPTTPARGGGGYYSSQVGLTSPSVHLRYDTVSGPLSGIGEEK